MRGNQKRKKNKNYFKVVCASSIVLVNQLREYDQRIANEKVRYMFGQ